MEHDYRVDTRPVVTAKKAFLKRVRVPFLLALLLTGVVCLGTLRFYLFGTLPKPMNDIHRIALIRGVVYSASMLCAFVSLIKIAVDSRPFSRTLTVCMYIIAALHLAASGILPRFPGYKTDFQIFGNSQWTLLDGRLFTMGILLWLLAAVIREGFSLQQESEEIL